MEVYQIKVFLEVARHLSFTEAADSLKLTQPAVSAKIKSLESELGTPLFYRLGRKIQLTEVGQFLLEESPKLIEVENELLARVEEIKKGKFGSLKIGCTAAIADGWLPNIAFQYRQAYPGIQTQCIVFESADFLYRAIIGNQIDVGISDISFEEFAEISATPIDTIRYCLMAASTHPLADRKWLSLRELTNQSWALLPGTAPSRLMFETRLLELGLKRENFAAVETVETLSLMRTYLLQGQYLGFASDLEFQTERAAGILVAIPLQEFALCGNIFLLAPRRRHESMAARSHPMTRRSRSTSPVQKFTALIQALQNSEPQADPIPTSAAPTRFRSPAIATRVHSQRLETLTLTIGIQNGTIPTVTAGLVIQKLGLLEHFLPRTGRYSATQFQIRWRDFATGAPIIEGLHAGHLDVGVLGDYPLLLSAVAPHISQGKPTRLVSFVSTNPDGSCNAMMVPSASKLQSVEDLRGRVLAVPFRSSAHGMVIRSLNSANLLPEVKLTALETPTFAHLREQPLQPADGYAHFAPFHDIACRQGSFRYLASNELHPLPAFHGVVVSDELATDHPDIVVAYLNALVAAQHWYSNTPAALALISQWTHLDAEIVAQILANSHDKTQPNRFFSETKIRPDWIKQHIAHLSLIPGSEALATIDFDRWIQPEFLHKIMAGQEWI